MLRWICARAAPDGLGAGEEERRLQRPTPGTWGSASAGAVAGHRLLARSGSPVRIWPSMPRMSMRQLHHLAGGTRSRTSCWWRRARPRRGPSCPAPRRVRRAQAVDAHDAAPSSSARARRWRISGSSIAPLALAHVDDDVELLLEAAVAGGGRRAALEAERGHGHVPAVVDAADDVLLRAAGVGEEHLGELGRAVDLLDGPDLDAGLLHRAQQVGDALVLGGVGVGAAEDEDVVGDEPLGGPDLLAVDDPLVAVEHGLGAERGEVGAGVGLGEALAPGDLAREDLGQEELLLLLGAPLQDGRARRACRRRSRPAAGRRRGGTPRPAPRASMVERPLPPYSLGQVAQIQPPSKSVLRPLLLELRPWPRASSRSPRRTSRRAGWSSSQRADLDTERFGFGRVAQVHAPNVDRSVQGEAKSVTTRQVPTGRGRRGRARRGRAPGAEAARAWRLTGATGWNPPSA